MTFQALHDLALISLLSHLHYHTPTLWWNNTGLLAVLGKLQTFLPQHLPWLTPHQQGLSANITSSRRPPLITLKQPYPPTCKAPPHGLVVFPS